MIPEGQSLVMQVLNKCGDVLYSQNTGVTLADLDLGTITVSEPPVALALSGTVVDCSNNPVASGWVNVLLEGLNYRIAVTKGSFTMNISRCSAVEANLQVTAGDYGTSQQGSASRFSVTTGTQNLGQLSACGVSTIQSINLSLGSIAYTLTVAPDSIAYFAQGTTMNVDAMSNAGENPYKRISFNIQGVTGTGSYSCPLFDLEVGSEDFMAPAGSPPVQITIASYGPVNGYITGSLSGTLADTVSKINYPLSGSFNILRSN
jgi:hypothetical protein